MGFVFFSCKIRVNIFSVTNFQTKCEDTCMALKQVSETSICKFAHDLLINCVTIKLEKLKPYLVGFIFSTHEFFKKDLPGSNLDSVFIQTNSI